MPDIPASSPGFHDLAICEHPCGRCKSHVKATVAESTWQASTVPRAPEPSSGKTSTPKQLDTRGPRTRTAQICRVQQGKAHTVAEDRATPQTIVHPGGTGSRRPSMKENTVKMAVKATCSANTCRHGPLPNVRGGGSSCRSSLICLWIVKAQMQDTPTRVTRPC